MMGKIKPAVQSFCHMDIMETQSSQENLQSQALTEHLRDLRSCLIVSLLAVLVGFGAAYSVIESISTYLFKPLTNVLPEGASLIFTSYQEGFFFI